MFRTYERLDVEEGAFGVGSTIEDTYRHKLYLVVEWSNTNVGVVDLDTFIIDKTLSVDVVEPRHLTEKEVNALCDRLNGSIQMSDFRLLAKGVKNHGR